MEVGTDAELGACQQHVACVRPQGSLTWVGVEGVVEQGQMRSYPGCVELQDSPGEWLREQMPEHGCLGHSQLCRL